MKKVLISFIFLIVIFNIDCKQKTPFFDYDNAVATLINFYFREREGGFIPPLPPPNQLYYNSDSIILNMKHRIILNRSFSDTLSNLRHLPLRDWAMKLNDKAIYLQIPDKITLDTLRNIQIKLIEVDTTILFRSRIDEFCSKHNVDGIFTVSNPFYFKQRGTDYFTFYIMYLVDGLTQTELAVLLEYKNQKFKVIKIQNFLRDRIS